MYDDNLSKDPFSLSIGTYIYATYFTTTAYIHSRKGGEDF